MFWDILEEPRKALLKKVVEKLPVSNSYLAGGTALALIFGHRKSIDFDWFTPQLFDPEELYQNISKVGKVKVAETKKGTFHAYIDGIRVTWLWYPNPLIEPLQVVEGWKGLRIASVIDIALMKWSAISSRGARKDFIDLYHICRNGYSLESMYRLLSKKYPQADINYYHMIKSLSYFEDAECEPMPEMKTNLDWQEVKRYFLQNQKTLLDLEQG